MRTGDIQGADAKQDSKKYKGNTMESCYINLDLFRHHGQNAFKQPVSPHSPS